MVIQKECMWSLKIFKRGDKIIYSDVRAHHQSEILQCIRLINPLEPASWVPMRISIVNIYPSFM